MNAIAQTVASCSYIPPSSILTPSCSADSFLASFTTALTRNHNRRDIIIVQNTTSRYIYVRVPRFMSAHSDGPDPPSIVGRRHVRASLTTGSGPLSLRTALASVAVVVVVLVLLCGSVADATAIVDPDLPVTPTPSPSPDHSSTREFTVNDITTASYLSVTRVTPRSLCPASEVSFQRVLYEDDVHPYRIPHSAITMDNLTCGRFSNLLEDNDHTDHNNNDTNNNNSNNPNINTNDNIIDQKLFADDYIALVPISILFNEERAVSHHAAILYDEFFTRNRTFTRTFFDFARENQHRSTVFIGLEWLRDRNCNDTITVPKLTYVFFARFDNPVNLAALLPYETYLRIPAQAPFHISFTPTSIEGLAEYGCVFYRPTPTPTPRNVPLRLCFPRTARVDVLSPRSGRWRETTIDQVQIGDVVRDADGEKSRVVGFSHRHATQWSMFRRLSFNETVIIDDTAGERIQEKQHRRYQQDLIVSHGHLVILSDHSLIRAADIRPGHRIRTMYHTYDDESDEYDGDDGFQTINASLPHPNHHHRRRRQQTQRRGTRKQNPFSTVLTVTHVSDVWDQGLYNPHTTSGSLLVNGVAVSCYTSAVPFRMAHALLTPVRAAVLFYYLLRASYVQCLSTWRWNGPMCVIHWAHSVLLSALTSPTIRKASASSSPSPPLPGTISSTKVWARTRTVTTTAIDNTV